MRTVSSRYISCVRRTVWLASHECLLLGNQSGSTEFCFGSIAAMGHKQLSELLRQSGH